MVRHESAPNAKCVGDTALNDGENVERRGILVPCRQLCRECASEARIGGSGAAIERLCSADLPGKDEGHLWSIDEGNARLEGEREVFFRARKHATVTGRKKESSTTKRQPSRTVNRVGIVGDPVDIVDGENGVLVSVKIGAYPVAVGEQIACAEAKWLVKWIRIRHGSDIRASHVHRYVKILLRIALRSNGRTISEDAQIQMGREIDGHVFADSERGSG